MYDLLAKLSPALGENLEEIKSILASATARPYASLETVLDMLSQAIADEQIETPIARTHSEIAARNAYYQSLYDLRDRFADGRDWGIRSLAGLDEGQLVEAAAADNSYLHSLKHLLPFAVTGRDFDDSLRANSFNWQAARAQFLARMLDAGTADRLYGLSGEATSFRYVDTDTDETLSVLSPRAAVVAQNQGTEERLESFLNNLSYDHVVAFGSDNADAPDELEGTAGDDQLFGEGGDDVLSGLAGDDFLEGGVGNDTLHGDHGDDILAGGPGSDALLGGEGFDSYLLAALAVDEDSNDPTDTIDPANHYVIVDEDGIGEVVVGGTPLTGGDLDPEAGEYYSADGRHTYSFSTSLLERGTLDIDGVVEIQNFLNGDLGIVLGQPAEPLDDIPPHRIFNPAFGLDEMPGDGEDYVYAGEGASIVSGLDSNDVILGGPGADMLFAAGEGEDIDTPRGEIAFDLFEREALSGGMGDDVLFGSAHADHLEGNEGSDTIYGGAGADMILGDGLMLAVRGEERTLHSDGTTEMREEPGFNEGLFQHRFHFIPHPNPSITDSSTALADSPDAGNDTIEAGAGDDLVLGGSGNDFLHGGSGDDKIHGGSGHDRIFGGEGADALYGDAGDDLLDAGRGAATADGGEGDDILRGEGMLRGGPGADRIIPRGAAHILLGDGDTVEFRNSTLIVQIGEDHPVDAVIEMDATLAPTDVAVFWQPGDAGEYRWSLGVQGVGGLSFEGDLPDWTALTVRFADGTTWNHAELAARVVDFIEPVGLSPMYPTSAADTLYGTAGSDVLSGGAGDDTYFIKAGGHDAVDAGAGDDVVHLGNVRASDTEVFSASADFVLRYPGGELRLIGQGLPGGGVNAVVFDRDATTWDRAELDARASPLESNQLDAQIERAMPGEAFSLTLAEDLFDDAYTVGTATLEVSTANGTDLPAWLAFDPETRRFIGAPQESDVGAVPLIVALRDAGSVVAIAPIVITVGEVDAPAEEPSPPASDPVVEPPATSAPPQAAPTTEVTVVTAPTSEPAPADAVQTASTVEAPAFELPLQRTATSTPSSTTESAELSIVAAADTRARPPGETSVGAIEDTTYLRIDSLLSSPASTHASGFMERYSEAIQEFRRRQEPPADSTPSEPPPTDEEMAMYNDAMHAWLDGDAQRLASGAAEAWDFGGMTAAWFTTGVEPDRGSSLGGQSLARPSLGAAPTLQRPPGLGEGLVKLGA